MADPRIAKALELKDAGATKVAFGPDGEVASVEFGPAYEQEDQHDDSKPVVVTPARRPTGQLVPRVGSRSSD